MTDILTAFGFGSATAVAFAALLLRLSLGGLFLAHAWLKYAVFTPKGAAQFFASLGGRAGSPMSPLPPRFWAGLP